MISIVIQSNMAAMNTNRQLGINVKQQNKTAQKISSGYRINVAADDAAGLAISEKMRKQIRGLDQGVRNTQDGVSLCQVADGALAEVNEMLSRINVLSVQAANGTNSYTDRVAIQKEINALKQEINRIGRTTKFNNRVVFDNDSKPIETIVKETPLIYSKCFETGYMNESREKVTGSIKFYYAAMNLDFQHINPVNISNLYNKSFSLTCGERGTPPIACDDVFKFSFIDGNGMKSQVIGTDNGEDLHEFIIDLHGMKSGQEIVDTMYNLIKNNPINNNSNRFDVNLGEFYRVNKVGSDKLMIYKHNSYSTDKEFIETQYPKPGFENYYKVSADDFKIREKIIPYGSNTSFVQTSGEAGDRIDIAIDYMNTDIIGVEDIDVTTEEGATLAIDEVGKAIKLISRQRAIIGGYQNRLEHTIANESNVIENTTAAESQIRDADMAKEIVAHANLNILTQAGQAMLTQANRLNDGVLTLLNG